MSKVTLTREFDLPEDRTELNIVVNAPELASVIWNLDYECRSCLKHGYSDDFKSPEDVFEWVRSQLMDATQLLEQ